MELHAKALFQNARNRTGKLYRGRISVAQEVPPEVPNLQAPGQARKHYGRQGSWTLL